MIACWLVCNFLWLWWKCYCQKPHGTNSILSKGGQFLGSKWQKKLWTQSWCDHSWSVLWSHECRLTHVQIYLSLFDTGSVEQWLKFLTKLNLVITSNGLTTGPAKFNLTQLLLKWDSLQHFNNKAKELENEINAHHAECISAVSRHIFPKNALQMQSVTCKRSICTIQWPSVSTSHVGISKMTILPYSPHMAEWHKRSVTMKLLNWSTKNYQIHMKSNLEHAKKCQEWKAKKASSCDEI